MVRVLSEQLPGPVGGESDHLPVVDVTEDSQGPGDSLLPSDLHHLEAGSDSEAGSSSSFEVLLPDFSSLGLSDIKQFDTTSVSGETAREKRSPTPEADPRSRPDLVTLLLEENRRLRVCLLENTQCISNFHLQAKHEAPDSNGLETKAEQKEISKKEKKSAKKSVSKPGKTGSDNNNVSILNLSEQLNVAEEAQAQLSQDLQRVTQEKLEMQNKVRLHGEGG